jgi:hypothetical protein
MGNSLPSRPLAYPFHLRRVAEEVEQELNVRYVIETRAKERLYLVDRKRISAMTK